MKDAKAMQKDADQEMSMEEILASIRKYVTDDGSSPSAPASSSAPSPAAAKSPSTSTPAIAAASTQSLLEEEEVLDLKKIQSIADHPRREEQQTQQASPSQPLQQPQTSGVTQQIPNVTSSYPTYAAAHAPTQGADPLLSSGKTMTSSAQALSRLVEAAKVANEPAHPHEVPMAGGMTIEQLTIQAMTPLLRQWMDANIATLVERLVQKEIENITAEFLNKK